ncbi:MAG: ABC transporter permease [Ilumatobacteraceae bacterium]
MATIYHRSRAVNWLAIAPIFFIFAFIVAPVLNIFVSSLQFESLNLLRTEAIRNVVWFTTWQSLVSTALALTVALPLAFVTANFKFKAQRLTTSLISMPFILPSIVVGVAFLQILPNNFHRTAFALILAHVYFNFGFASRLISARWLQIHPHLDDAARTLGASPLKLFTTLTLPLLSKAIANAALIVFTLCFTSYGVVRVLGGPSRSTLETEIYFRAMQLGDVSGAMLLSALQVVIIALLFVVTTKASSKKFEQSTRPTISRQKSLQTRKQKVIAATIISIATLFAIVPVLAIALKSINTNSRFTTTAWRTVFTSPEIAQSITKTLIYAVIAMSLATLLGLLSACSVAYNNNFRFISGLTTLPIVISAVSIGLGIIITFDTQPFDWRGAQLMLPLAHTLVALPLVMRIISPVLQAIPDSLRQASSVLGASPCQTWLNIDFKIIRRAAISAAAISATVSIGEFGASSFLARRGAETLPVMISRLLSRPGDSLQSQAFALATLLVMFSLAMIFVVDSFAKDKFIRDSHA